MLLCVGPFAVRGELPEAVDQRSEIQKNGFALHLMPKNLARAL